MPSIVYGGLRYTQIRHAIQCKKCLDTIESKDIHDFKMCSCGAVGIDGGIFDGNRIIGDSSYIEVRSMYCATVKNKKMWLPQSVIEENFKAENVQNTNFYERITTDIKSFGGRPLTEKEQKMKDELIAFLEK